MLSGGGQANKADKLPQEQTVNKLYWAYDETEILIIEKMSTASRKHDLQ